MNNFIAENIDQYSIPVTFTYRKSYYFKTLIGGIVSLIIIIGLFVYLASLLIDMVLRDFPLITKSISYTDNPFNISILKDITYEDLNAALPPIPEEMQSKEFYWHSSLGIRYSNSTFRGLIDIDTTRFDIRMEEVTFSNDVYIRKPLNFNKCTKFANLTEGFNNLSLNKTYCLQDNFNLAGIPHTSGSSWIEIKVGICDEDEKCKPINDTLKWIEDVQIEFYTYTYIFNFTSPLSPVTHQVTQVYWDCIPYITKISNLELGIDTLRSYNGYFPRFLSMDVEYDYILSNRNWESQTKDIDSEFNLVIITISSSRMNILVERTFIDLIKQVAYVGGISTIGVLLGYLLVFFFAQFVMTESIMNDSYNVIHPDKYEVVNKQFDAFIRDHYNNQIRLFIKFNKNQFKKKKNNQRETESIHLNTFREVDLMKMCNDPNALECFFTLERIEKMYNFKLEDRMLMIKQACKSIFPNEDNIIELQQINLDDFDYDSLMKIDKGYDFYSNFLVKKDVNKIEWQANYLIYETTKYQCHDKIYFNPVEVWKFIIYTLCCCNRCNKPKSVLIKKFELLKAAERRLEIDYDLVSILKTVEGLDKFTKVFFDDSQRRMFYSVTNPVINLNTGDHYEIEGETQNDLENVHKMREIIEQIVEGRHLDQLDQRLFKIMGIPPEDIQRFEELMLEEKIKKEEEARILKEKELREQLLRSGEDDEVSEVNREKTNLKLDKEKIENELMNKFNR